MWTLLSALRYYVYFHPGVPLSTGRAVLLARLRSRLPHLSIIAALLGLCLKLTLDNPLMYIFIARLP